MRAVHSRNGRRVQIGGGYFERGRGRSKRHCFQPALKRHKWRHGPGEETENNLQQKDDRLTENNLQQKDDHLTENNLQQKDDRLTENSLQQKDDRLTDNNLQQKDDRLTENNLQQKDDRLTDNNLQQKHDRLTYSDSEIKRASSMNGGSWHKSVNTGTALLNARDRHLENGLLFPPWQGQQTVRE